MALPTLAPPWLFQFVALGGQPQRQQPITPIYCSANRDHAMGAFVVDQDALAFQSPTIAAKAAIAAQHTMTWDQYSDPVGGAGRRCRTYRPWRANAARDLRIAKYVAFAHIEEKSPNANLERRTAGRPDSRWPAPAAGVSASAAQRSRAARVASTADDPGSSREN